MYSNLSDVAAVAEWYRYRTVAGLVTSSSPVPIKTRRVGQRCTLNLSRAETSSRWCGVVVRRGWCQLRCRPRHLTMVQNCVVPPLSTDPASSASQVTEPSDEEEEVKYLYSKPIPLPIMADAEEANPGADIWCLEFELRT
ncbi:uncharacterized protein TNCV_4563901 [Trichonephila clavipes]|uniref:Uncharacterized protein n=1 Tax=Trichonephila clavipes TaxID=2585209 RepID=A0A8X7BE42_TRICX|nr:uncharacterized protein TNCV_4563901 [Trichonephila clavipes]